MFVSQAHSFRQQARLAVTLAWVAGYTNIVTLIACGTVTSHTSGTTSSFGHDLLTGQWGMGRFTFFLLMAFFIGAAISGVCMEVGKRRKWESIYVLPIVVEMFLLGGFAVMLQFGDREVMPVGMVLYGMTGLAASAMGLQNATITRISNGQVRTTHVTGVLTDLGQESVQFLWWVWERHVDVPPGKVEGLVRSVYFHPPARRLFLLGSILVTFALGAGLGTVAYVHWPRLAMFPPVFFLLWIVYQDFARPIAEIEPSSLVGGASGLNLPGALAVYHLRKDHDRKGRVHRMPNLMAWAERLAAGTKVVILDLGEVAALDANAAMELRAVLGQFGKQERELIISGVSREQLERMHAFGMDDLLGSENVCADLELAIARGLNILERDGGQGEGIWINA